MTIKIKKIIHITMPIIIAIFESFQEVGLLLVTLEIIANAIPAISEIIPNLNEKILIIIDIVANTILSVSLSDELLLVLLFELSFKLLSPIN